MRDKCPCGRNVIEIVSGVYLCENKEWPHLWQGIGGITDKTSIAMAQEVVALRAHIEALTAENERLKKQVAKLERKVTAGDDLLYAMDRLVP